MEDAREHLSMQGKRDPRSDKPAPWGFTRTSIPPQGRECGGTIARLGGGEGPLSSTDRSTFMKASADPCKDRVTGGLGKRDDKHKFRKGSNAIRQIQFDYHIKYKLLSDPNQAVIG
jgi:hypothetical protein